MGNGIYILLVLLFEQYWILVVTVNYMRGPMLPLHHNSKSRNLYLRARRKNLLLNNKTLRSQTTTFGYRNKVNETVRFIVKKLYGHSLDGTEGSNLKQVIHPKLIGNRKSCNKTKTKVYPKEITTRKTISTTSIKPEIRKHKIRHLKRRPTTRETTTIQPTTTANSILDFSISTSTSESLPPTSEPLLDFSLSTPPEDAPLFDFPAKPLLPLYRSRLQEYHAFCRIKLKELNLKQHRIPEKSMNRKKRNQLQLQDRHLTLHAITYFIDGSKFKSESWVLSLLIKTGEIFKSICPGKYMPEYMVNLVVLLFQSLYTNVNPSRAEYLDIKSFEWIESILDKCDSESKNIEFKYETDYCKGLILAGEDGKFICTPWKEDINFTYTDPFLDLVWHIYNAVVARCFQCFHENYRMFHKFSMSIIDLLTTPLQTRWKHNSCLLHSTKVQRFWSFLFGPNYQIVFQNVVRCTEFILNNQTNIFISRSPRFFYTDSLRFNSIKNPI